MVVDSYTLYTEDLNSKFGFGDGDMFQEICIDFEEKNGLPFDSIDDHEVLRQVIKRYLLPKLDKRVTIYETFSTCHNPCRVTSVDGVEHEWGFEPIEAKPEYVVVTREQVLEIIPECIRDDKEESE